MFIDVARLKVGSVRYLLRRGVAFLQYTSLIVVVSLGSCWANCGGVDWCGSSWNGTRIIDCGKERGANSEGRRKLPLLVRHLGTKGWLILEILSTCCTCWEEDRKVHLFAESRLKKFAAKEAEKMAGLGGKSTFKNLKGPVTGANAV
jgi:hypothetical protein